MTPAIAHLQARADHFRALCRLYIELSDDRCFEEAERAAYADIADLLSQVEDRFQRAVIELDDQPRLPLVVRNIPIGVGLDRRVG